MATPITRYAVNQGNVFDTAEAADASNVALTYKAEIDAFLDDYFKGSKQHNPHIGTARKVLNAWVSRARPNLELEFTS